MTGRPAAARVGPRRAPELVCEGRQQERGGHDRADHPGAGPRLSGAISAAWVAAVTPMTARTMVHDHVDRISKPRIRATGTAFIVSPRSPAARGIRRGSSHLGRWPPGRSLQRRLARPVAARPRRDHAHCPTTIAVSCQNRNGKSWRSLSVDGSKVYEPLVKRSRRRSRTAIEAADRDRATTRSAAIIPIARPRTARQVRARSFPRRRAAIMSAAVPRRWRARRADEDAAHVAHVGPFGAVEHGYPATATSKSGGPRRGRPGWRRGISEVGSCSRSRRLPGAALLDDDPDRVQEQRQHDRHDHQRGRTTDQDRAAPRSVFIAPS